MNLTHTCTFTHKKRTKKLGHTFTFNVAIFFVFENKVITIVVEGFKAQLCNNPLGER